jgi:hypothetical protein
MIIIRNDEDKDLVIKVPGENNGIPSEHTLANGEEYEVSDDQAKDILKWNFAAYFEGEPNDEKSDDEDEAAAGENGADEDEPKTATVTNDRDFDVEVTYTENEEEKTATVKAGEDIEVPTDQEEAVKKQIADAKEPEADDEGEETEEQKTLAAERADLAKREAKLVKEKAELRYNALVAEGKLVPAQKADFMALATKGTDEEIAVAEGKTKTVSELLESFIGNGRAVKVGEEDGEGGDGNEAESDVELTQEEKKVTELFDNDKEDIKAMKKEEEK